MTTIDRCPSLLTEGFASYSPEALANLFDGRKVSHILNFASPENESAAITAAKNVGRLSLSGAQPKFGLILNENNELQYSNESIQSTYILKPRPIGYHLINRDFCAANENLTMQMAQQIYGIETAVNALCFYADGQPAYLTRRFDIHNNEKFAQEDFASLIGVSSANGGSDFKYINGSYEECAEVIRKYVKVSMVDILRFFRVVVFNFITLNDDAHLKNFSLVKRGGEYRLSPAYDLINTSLHISEPRLFALEKGLFKEGMHLTDTHFICNQDFLEFGRRIGLSQKICKKELSNFAKSNPAADELINRSFLPKELKLDYMQRMHYRQVLLRPR